MIKLSIIDENLSIYKDNIVVLFGFDVNTKFIIELLRFNNINIDYICMNNTNFNALAIEDIPTISAKNLKILCKNKLNFKTDKSNKVVVQIMTKNIDLKIQHQLLSIGVDTIIPYDEAYSILLYKMKKDNFNENPFFKIDCNENIKNYVKKQYEVNEYITNNWVLNQYLFICVMNHVDSSVLQETFYKKRISRYNTLHNAKNLEKIMSFSIDKKIKIITAIEDPLSASVSQLYHFLYNIHDTETICMFDLENQSWLEDGGDVQKIFDEQYNYSNEKENPVLNFIEGFKESLLDLSKYPFDKDKGYTIIKEGNIEVFVYQLEKMNNITKEMSDWIGEKSFDKWVVSELSNDASSKWISKSYKQAQKELQFSQELFDKCYNNEWLEHFYSNEDIENFKSRWKNQVIK